MAITKQPPTDDGDGRENTFSPKLVDRLVGPGPGYVADKQRVAISSANGIAMLQAIRFCGLDSPASPTSTVISAGN